MSKYIVFEAHDTVSGESRIHSFAIGTAPLIDYSTLPNCGSDVVVEMVRKYVDINTSLDAKQGWHFTNWALAFDRLKQKQKKKSGLVVNVYQASNDQEFGIIATELTKKFENSGADTIVKEINVA
jgi:hypothetical protein